jgi:hypothetical protein
MKSAWRSRRNKSSGCFISEGRSDVNAAVFSIPVAGAKWLQPLLEDGQPQLVHLFDHECCVSLRHAVIRSPADQFIRSL